MRYILNSGCLKAGDQNNKGKIYENYGFLHINCPLHDDTVFFLQ